MTVRWEILALILACMAVTVLPRVLPMAMVNLIKPPAWFLAWLRHIPVAVISALFFREALLTDGDWRSWTDPYFLAAWPTLAAALITRNLFAAIICGIAFFTLFRLLLAA